MNCSAIVPALTSIIFALVCGYGSQRQERPRELLIAIEGARFSRDITDFKAKMTLSIGQCRYDSTLGPVDPVFESRSAINWVKGNRYEYCHLQSSSDGDASHRLPETHFFSERDCIAVYSPRAKTMVLCAGQGRKMENPIPIVFPESSRLEVELLDPKAEIGVETKQVYGKKLLVATVVTNETTLEFGFDPNRSFVQCWYSEGEHQILVDDFFSSPDGRYFPKRCFEFMLQNDAPCLLNELTVDEITFGEQDTTNFEFLFPAATQYHEDGNPAGATKLSDDQIIGPGSLQELLELSRSNGEKQQEMKRKLLQNAMNEEAMTVAIKTNSSRYFVVSGMIVVAAVLLFQINRFRVRVLKMEK